MIAEDQRKQHKQRQLTT